jgi:alpha-glucoside transport system permease protein
MTQLDTVEERDVGAGARLVAWIGRLFLAVIIPLIAFAVIYAGFLFLRDSNAPRWAIAVVAIIWGVGGVALLYWAFNSVVEHLPGEWSGRLQPFVFVGPAMAILIWYLALPVLRTFRLSLFDRDGQEFVGLANYATVFTQDLLQVAIRNNLMWIVFGSTFSVVSGLLVAVLADRSRFERVSKTLIFLPMAISFVGASVIWNFMYEVRPVELPQIGVLNGIVVALGGNPHPWDKWVAIAPWNNLFLILIVIWLQAGFIQGTIITVWTTVVIFTLKIFDVVWVMTGGQFGTHVIATQFYRQSFTARNSGVGSAIAIILLLAVIPVMIYNLRQFREQEAF